ncbi:MAG: prolyl oligopeptidase family serine peptidase [Planctomycetes bacterium]|nr:prolyl oligopeptidase family serine peptidase [Planctomycetota bacterium]
MAYLQINHFSAALSKMASLAVIVPEGAGPFRAVYQLHGLSDDHTAWQRRTSIERYADRYGIIVAMPDGARSFYANAPDSPDRYEDHILETVALVDRMFRTIDGPHARGIGGLSMGGYGAMKLGLKHPRVFGSIAAHSACMDMRAYHRDRAFPDLAHFFGPTFPKSEDVFALATASRRSRSARPRIRIDCGIADFLIDHNRRMHRHLDRLGIAHEYQEFPGEHNWEYWDQHIDQALRFHVTSFAQATSASRRAVRARRASPRAAKR